MARKEFLDYVWDKCVEPQLGYSFSIPHDIGYSLIGWQEVNLFERFNPLFWECACLNVNSGEIGEYNQDDFNEDEVESDEEKELESEEEVETEENKKKKTVAPNYQKIAKAIYDAQASGAEISFPDINTSKNEFYPDIENNAILYNLATVSGVSDSLYARILEGRPYFSLENFLEKVQPTVGECFSLIKAGSFNRLLNKDTRTVVYYYLNLLAEQNVPFKEKLTVTDLKKMIKLNLIKGFDNEVRFFKYKAFLDKNQLDPANKNRYLLTDDTCIKFFNLFFKDKLVLSKDEYGYLPGDKIFVKSTPFKKIYESYLEPLMNFYKSEEGLKQYHEQMQEIYKNELKEKYCVGSVSKWQFDTMYYYHDGHELANMNDAMYNTRNFEELPLLPADKNDVCSLAGTVIGSNRVKHMVSILTKYGVVDIKMYKETFDRFNQRISVIDPTTKKKTVIDESWFKRGNKILVYGQRKENLFTSRNYRKGNYSLSVGLISEVNIDGSLQIRYSRNKK